MGASDTWTLKFNPGEEYNKYGRNLVVKPVSGSVGFSATLNGGATPSVASSADGSEAVLFFAADQFVSGENTIVLTRTDGGADFTLDAMRVEEKLYRYTTSAEVADDLTIPAGSRVVFDVQGKGTTVKYNGTISGGGEIVKIGNGNLQLRNAANTYSGGTHLMEGSIQTYNDVNKTTSLGSGTVTVEAGAQIRIGCPIDNDFVFNGNDSTNATALVFNGDKLGNAITLGGAFTFNGTNYFESGWAGDAAVKDVEKITFNGAVSGDKLIGAPHCRVRFAGSVALDELEGCYGNGNLGAYVLANASTSIATLTIDQTRVLLGTAIDFQNTTLKFTGEHKVDGLGYFDIRNNAVTVKTIAVVNQPGVDDQGCQVINTGNAIKNVTIKSQSGWVYAKFDGNLGLYGTKATFAPRHHTMCGTLSGSGVTYTFKGGSISNVTEISGSGNVTFNLYDMGEGSLSGLTSLGSSSSAFYKFKANQLTPWKTAIKASGMHSSTFKNSTFVTIMDGGTVKAKSLRYYNWPKLWEDKGWTEETPGKSMDSNYQIDALAGVYDCSGDNGGPNESMCVQGGTIKVMSPVGEGTPITFVGTDGDITVASNWEDASGNPLAEPPDFEMPTYSPLFKDGVTVNVNSDIMVVDLRLSGGATINGSGTVRVGGKVLVNDGLAAGTSYAINAPLEIIQDTLISIPTNGTFAINGGVSGTASLTLNGSQVTNCMHRSPFATTSSFSNDPDGGEFVLGGVSTLSGNIRASNAIVRVRGQLGTDGDTSMLQVYCSVGDAKFVTNQLCAVRFEGAKVYKRVSMVGHGYSQPNAYCAIVMTANSTNEFYGAYAHNVSHDVQFRSGSVTWFRGGFSCIYDVYFQAPDADDSATEVHVACQLSIAQDTNSDRAWTLNGGARYFWEQGISGNVGRLMVLDPKTVVECNVDDPFVFNKRGFGYLGGKLRLNGTRFTAPFVNGSADGITEGVGEGARFVIDKAIHANFLNSTFAGKVTGTADLVMNGTNTLSLAASQSTSTGALCAESGVISMDATSTWAGDWKVTNGKFALTGIKRVADGQKLYVNGTEQPEGLYGATGSGASHEVTWITGDGKLRVGSAGTMFIIK